MANSSSCRIQSLLCTRSQSPSRRRLCQVCAAKCIHRNTKDRWRSACSTVWHVDRDGNPGQKRVWPNPDLSTQSGRDLFASLSTRAQRNVTLDRSHLWPSNVLPRRCPCRARFCLNAISNRGLCLLSSSVRSSLSDRTIRYLGHIGLCVSQFTPVSTPSLAFSLLTFGLLSQSQGHWWMQCLTYEPHSKGFLWVRDDKPKQNDKQSSSSFARLRLLSRSESTTIYTGKMTLLLFTLDVKVYHWSHDRPLRRQSLAVRLEWQSEVVDSKKLE
jgi:hypothetical protein